MFSNRNKTKPCTVFGNHAQSMKFMFPGLIGKARPSQALIKLSNFQTNL